MADALIVVRTLRETAEERSSAVNHSVISKQPPKKSGMMNVMQTKSVPVTMKRVVEAYRLVRANKGSAGVDDSTLQAYEADVSKQLYKVCKQAYLRQLLSTSGKVGANTQGRRKEAGFRHTHCKRQSSAAGNQNVSGATLRSNVQ